MLANSAPRLLVLEAELAGALDSVARVPAELSRLWLVGGGDPGRGWPSLPAEPFPEDGPEARPHAVRPGDTLSILYTSGTTGLSKGVCCPHAQFHWWGVLTAEHLEVTGDDVLYTVLPLFHTNALNTFFQALLYGAELRVGARFSASRFWREAHETGATVTYLLGAMVQILRRGPRSPADTAHRVRIALSPATPPEAVGDFRARFGVDLVDGYGSTETNFVIGGPLAEQRPGTMGRVVEGFEARVVDDDDRELPAGVPGELVLRHSEPFSFATGYYALPGATVESWRNLWFHTGDRVVRDEDGFFRFVDRLKDAIRRRGENISSFEVEQALTTHPDVESAAVVPVASELGEDDVLAFVVPRPGATLEPEALVRHLEPRLASFAIPRYLELVTELPLTENGKVRKFVLRERGVQATTWDREAPRRGQ
jgi:crotonobetaine/carnitine-CoA ligase